MTSSVMRVTGTADAAEIAAMLAAVSSVMARKPQPGGYERWRRGRVTALRVSANDR